MSFCIKEIESAKTEEEFKTVIDFYLSLSSNKNDEEYLVANSDYTDYEDAFLDNLNLLLYLEENIATLNITDSFKEKLNDKYKFIQEIKSKHPDISNEEINNLYFEKVCNQIKEPVLEPYFPEKSR